MNTKETTETLTLPKETYLFKEGDPGNNIYVLLEGAVEILKRDQAVTQVNQKGAFLGEIAAILETPHSYSVRTLMDSQFLLLPTPLEKLLASQKNLLPKLLKTLEERYRFTLTRIHAFEEEIWHRCVEVFVAQVGMRFFTKNPRGDVKRETYGARLRLEERQKLAQGNSRDPEIIYSLASEYGIRTTVENEIEKHIGSFIPFEVSHPMVYATVSDDPDEMLFSSRKIARELVIATNHLAGLELASHLEGLDQKNLEELESSLQPEKLQEILNDLFLTHCCRGLNMDQIRSERKKFSVMLEGAIEDARRRREPLSLMPVAKMYGIEEYYSERVSELVAIYTAEDTSLEK